MPDMGRSTFQSIIHSEYFTNFKSTVRVRVQVSVAVMSMSTSTSIEYLSTFKYF